MGSGSPRRLDLLASIGLTPARVTPPDVDETPLRAETPRLYCERITKSKLAASHIAGGEIVLCADTTVAVGRRILGKPADRTEAAAFLRLLSGRRHQVITVVGVKSNTALRMKTVVTAVKLKRLSDHDISRYLASEDWQDKAGGYAIQGPAAAFVASINGSYTGVVGLPLAETAALLTSFGLEGDISA